MKNITVLSKDIAANMTLGQKLTTLGPPNNVDEAMMYELQKIGLFQKPLFKKVISMGHELNPSIFRWNDTVYMARADEHDVLHLFRLNEEYKVVIHLNIQNLSLLPSGEDPRVFQVDPHKDRFVMLFSHSHHHPIVMGIAEFTLDGLDNATILYCSAIRPSVDAHLAHKNWMAFSFNNSLMLIQSINPFHVVKLEPTNTGEFVATTVSMQGRIDDDWRYGHLHGGTPAVRIEGCCYLSFFHSKGWATGNTLMTYWAGAFTFSLEPPFKLLKISPVPIVSNELYTGAWVPYHNRHLDYVVFPMTFAINNDTIQMSFGHQDWEGMIGYLNLQEVLDSLHSFDTDSDRGSLRRKVRF